MEVLLKLINLYLIYIFKKNKLFKNKTIYISRKQYMVNYQLGKIYKIVDNTNGNIYIGSTCEPTLARRLSQHCGEYRFYLNKEIKKNITSFQIIKNNNYDIILI